MSRDAAELAFGARALAQAHPLTSLAKAAVDRAVAEEGRSQPLPELATWAGVALTTGYCLRRVEEEAEGRTLVAGPEPVDDETVARVDEAALAIAAALRRGGEAVAIADEDVVVAALDRIIASEVDRRVEQWRDSLDEPAQAELAQYITWWVVKGYALRAAEHSLGMVSATGASRSSAAAAREG